MEQFSWSCCLGRIQEKSKSLHADRKSESYGNTEFCTFGMKAAQLSPCFGAGRQQLVRLGLIEEEQNQHFYHEQVRKNPNPRLFVEQLVYL